MANHLVSVLGKGQSVQNPQLGRNYRETFYYLPGSEKAVKTAFVGNAIMELTGKSFTHFHLLGTSGSMWDVLFESLIKAEDLETEVLREWEKLYEKCNSDSVTDHDLQIIKKLYESHSGIKVFCYILPKGITPLEVQGIFNRIISLEEINNGDTVSLDITHGFRYQPMFLMMGQEFFVQIKGVSTKSVYYGSLESAVNYLPYDYSDEGFDLAIAKDQIPSEKQRDYLPLAPVMTFDQIPEFYNIINAAWYFNISGSTGKLLSNRLLKLNDQFISKLREFDFKIQAALIRDIRASAFAVKQETDKLINLNQDWFTTMMLKMIRELPEKLTRTGNDFSAILIVVRMYIDGGRYNNASLSLWECIIGYLSNCYEMKENQQTRYSIISALISRLSKDPAYKQDFAIFKKLKDIRNMFAHTKGISLKYDNVSKIVTDAYTTATKIVKSKEYSESLIASYPADSLSKPLTSKKKKNRKQKDTK